MNVVDRYEMHFNQIPIIFRLAGKYFQFESKKQNYSRGKSDFRGKIAKMYFMQDLYLIIDYCYYKKERTHGKGIQKNTSKSFNYKECMEYVIQYIQFYFFSNDSLICFSSSDNLCV